MISLLNTLKRIENMNEGDYFAAFYCMNSAKLCLNQLQSATSCGRVCLVSLLTLLISKENPSECSLQKLLVNRVLDKY